MPKPPQSTENEAIELRLLLDAIFLRYGYDFRDYAKASLKRRVHKRLQAAGLPHVSELTHQLLNDKSVFEQLLLDLTVNVTEMFRDPSFFRTLRERVLPQLAHREHIKIWHAGCATGEEVYSMAILLAEAGLLDRCRIFATDLNEVVLHQARQGIYPAKLLRAYTENYQRMGGTRSFSDYYTARYDSAIIDAGLKEHIVFSAHNLATDGVFSEVDLIVCRNVVIYFDQRLQDRVFGLFADSLTPGGLLCLGSKESIRFSRQAGRFGDFDRAERIYVLQPETPAGEQLHATRTP